MVSLRFSWIACVFVLSGSASFVRADACLDLLQALENAKPGEQVALVHKIGNLGRKGIEAVPVLENLLDSPKQDLANQAARSLAQIGRPAVPALTKASEDADPQVSLRALWALSLIGPEAKDAIPTLVKLLDHEQDRIRGGALYALGEMGPAAGASAEKIVKAMRTRSAMVRYQAVLALGKIGTVALADLQRLLQDDLPDVRADAACAVSLFGKLAKEAIPDLESALKDNSEEVRAMAAFSLGSMAKEARGSLPQIVELLYDQDYQVQVTGFVASLSVGSGDPRLMQALREANKKGKWATPFILKQFGKEPGDAVQPLIKALQGKDPAERLGAAWSLGQIGLPARDAIPALRKAQNDPQLRFVAANSLKQINQGVFTDENPLVREWNRVLEKKVEAAVLFQQKLQPKKFQMSLQDPTTQRFFDDASQLYIQASLSKNTNLQQQMDYLFAKAGTDAIPALVRSVNVIAILSVGFT